MTSAAASACAATAARIRSTSSSARHSSSTRSCAASSATRSRSSIYRVSVQRQEVPPPQPMALPSPEQLAALRASNGNGAGNGNGNGQGVEGASTLAQGTTAALRLRPHRWPRLPEALRWPALRPSAPAPDATKLLPGLGAPRRGPMTLQRGDEAVGSAPAGGASSAGQPASAAKLGRNDPCWCGSGKKYKKCHGA